MAAELKKPTAVFQLRADPTLLQEVKALAAKWQISANRLLVEVIQDSLNAERDRAQEREWREGFERWAATRTRTILRPSLHRRYKGHGQRKCRWPSRSLRSLRRRSSGGLPLASCDC